MNLQGKTALVTGSAIRVGKAIAMALAREGANLIIHYGGSAEDAEQTAAEIHTLGCEAITVQANLADPAQITGLFEAVRDRFGRLDVLVNSAANFLRKPLLDITAEDWDRVMAINLRAPFLCIQQAAPLMRPGGGLIVNLSDLAGVYPWIGFAAHGVSKAGITHLTKQAARELAPEIRVNTIIPGPVMAAPGMDESQFQALGSHLPLGRVGSAQDVAQAVIFLAHNDFITGESITVDGGEAMLGPAWH